MELINPRVDLINLRFSPFLTGRDGLPSSVFLSSATHSLAPSRTGVIKYGSEIIALAIFNGNPRDQHSIPFLMLLLRIEINIFFCRPHEDPKITSRLQFLQVVPQVDLNGHRAIKWPLSMCRGETREVFLARVNLRKD